MAKYKLIRGPIDKSPIVADVAIKVQRRRFFCRIKFPSYDGVAIVGVANSSDYDKLIYIDLRYMLNDFIQFSLLDTSSRRFGRLVVNAVFGSDEAKKQFLSARRIKGMISSLECFRTIEVKRLGPALFSTENSVKLNDRNPIKLVGWFLVNTNR